MTTTASPSSGRRSQRERREHTRAQLIAATITCIAEHGYQATTTRRVAEIADVSLGALAHHFPSRLDLITSALDEISQRMTVDLPARIEACRSRQRDTLGILDALWSLFHGQLFTVWVKVWLAAAEEPDLYAALVPLEARVSAAISENVAAAAPTTPPQRGWTRRMGIVLDAMRGHAFITRFQPHSTQWRDDRWPAMRTELAALLADIASDDTHPGPHSPTERH
jgi:AcrR family transcriptional regulator